jgi:hypothetical protein
MRYLLFFFAFIIVVAGCKKVATTTPSYHYTTFEVAKRLFRYKDINGQDSSHLDNIASFGPYVSTINDTVFSGVLGHTFLFDSSLKVRVNDSLMQCLECYDGGTILSSSTFSINFPDIDSPIHWQLYWGKYFINYSYVYTAPFPYYNISFPDTIHYLQGFSVPCSLTNADSVRLRFLSQYQRTITFSGTINSINIAPNTFAGVQDSVFTMIMEVYNQHTELVNGNHYIFRKAYYVQTKTVLVP